MLFTTSRSKRIPGRRLQENVQRRETIFVSGSYKTKSEVIRAMRDIDVNYVFDARDEHYIPANLPRSIATTPQDSSAPRIFFVPRHVNEAIRNSVVDNEIETIQDWTDRVDTWLPTRLLNEDFGDFLEELAGIEARGWRKHAFLTSWLLRLVWNAIVYQLKALWRPKAV